jgi:hypothetical protein
MCLPADRSASQYSAFHSNPEQRSQSAVGQNIEVDHHAILQDVGVKSAGVDEFGTTHFRSELIDPSRP